MLCELDGGKEVVKGFVDRLQLLATRIGIGAAHGIRLAVGKSV